MTTFDESIVTDAVIAHKKGISLQQGRALRDNPKAAAEGAADAYKFAMKSLIGTFTTSIKDFNSLGAWSGVWFSLSAANSSGSTPRAISLNASDDGGSTYLGAVTLYTVPVSSAVQIIGFFDFATGVVHGTFSGTAAGTFTQTIAGASAAIDGIRFIGSTDITAGVMIHPNGGESAT